MVTEIVQRNNCYGCTACEAVCPTNSISMREDSEGFYYPIFDKNKCIQCRRCIKVCPEINGSVVVHSDLKRAYCGLHIDENIWEQSSSGGAYSAICKAVADEKKKTIFIGASYDKTNKVVHSYVKNFEEINAFRKSKYVQSDFDGILKLVKEFLIDGNYVVFSGTPCQIASLNNYLYMENIEATNCFTIDIVCHGVGSPLVFKRYLEWLECKYKSRVKKYSFRNRMVRFRKLFIHIPSITLENGKVIKIENDTYANLFLQKLICRPSCSTCKFSNMNRVSDITIGDFKRQYEIAPLATGIKNRSLIIPNSDKGKEIVAKLSNDMELFEADILKCVQANPPLDRQTIGSTHRSEFFNDLTIKNYSYQQLQKKYFSKKSVLLSIWLILPYRSQATIKRVLKK